MSKLRRQLLVGRRELHLVLLRDVGEELFVVEDVHLAHPPPGVDRLFERKRLVGHDEVFVKVVELPEASAGRAGAEGRVERKGTRLELVEGDAAVGAGVQFGIGGLALRVSRLRLFPLRARQDFFFKLPVSRLRLCRIEPLHGHYPLAGLERQLDGIRQPRTKSGVGFGGNHQAVYDDVDVVGLLLVKFGKFVNRVCSAVDPDAREAVSLHGGKRLLVAPLLALYQRSVDDDFCGTPLVAQYRLDDLLRRLLDDRLAALRAVRDGDRSVEDSQVVVNLGHGRDNRARVAARRSLLDGDRRREPLYLLDIGLLHPVEELPCIRRKRLDVAALPFSVKRVER